MVTHRELLPPGGTRKKRTAEQIAAAALWGSTIRLPKLASSTTSMVSYDPVLGTQGLSLATQMLNSVAGPYKDMQTLFGIAGGTVNVVIAPLSGNDDRVGRCIPRWL